MRRTLSTLAAVSLLAISSIVTASSAQADSRDGRCETGEFCYYHGYSQTGSTSDFGTSVPNYGTYWKACYVFKGPGAGSGQCIKNNAKSVWNRSGRAVTVYYNSYYGGDTVWLAPGTKLNLGRLADDNASHRFAGPRDPFPI